MKTRSVVMAGVLAAAMSTAAFAIDRDARMIDTVWGEATVYDGGDSLGLSLWSETATAEPEGRWAILAGGALGTVWPNAGDGVEYWELGLGLKHYLARDTSLSLLGLYRELDTEDRPDLRRATATMKHRLMPAADPVSPYVIAGAGLQTVEDIPEPTVDTDFTELLLVGGAGVDFMMAENFAIVFEGAWYITQELDGEESEDWFLGRVGMQYYWAGW